MEKTKVVGGHKANWFKIRCKYCDGVLFVSNGSAGFEMEIKCISCKSKGSSKMFKVSFLKDEYSVKEVLEKANSP